MITKIDLLEILSKGENSGVEFKRDSIQNHELAKELVALANLDGGLVILGVEDDGTVSGLKRNGLEEWVMTICRDKIRPAINPYFEVFKNLSVGKDVAVVRVLQGINVHTRWHNNKHDYYIRVGSQSRDPTPEELSRLFQQKGAIQAESRPVSGTRKGDLDHRRLKDYFRRVRGQQVPDDVNETRWHTLLVNTEIMANDSVTVAGLLLFGILPKRFLPQTRIDAMAFPGSEKDYAMRERSVLTGPLTPLMDQDGNILEVGLVEQALEFVRRNTPMEATIGSTGYRVDRSTYPEEAVREAIVNALIHRDYLFALRGVELAIYDNRLEIISPGRLPNGVTTEKMLDGIFVTRNEILKGVMFSYKYMESIGLGVNKIYRLMEKHNGTRPELIAEDDQFTVRLFAKR